MQQSLHSNMLAQQDLVETNIERSPVLNDLERRIGSPYKEVVHQGEILPFLWDRSSPRDPSSTTYMQEFTSSSGSGKSSASSTPESSMSSEEYCLEDGNRSSQELSTSTQGTNSKKTPTAVKATPKTALNKADMVEVPWPVPTRPKSFASQLQRVPQEFPTSQGGGVPVASQDSQCTTQETGSEYLALQSWGTPAQLWVEQAPWGDSVSPQQPGNGPLGGLQEPLDQVVQTLRSCHDVIMSTPQNSQRVRKVRGRETRPGCNDTSSMKRHSQ